ITGTPLLLGGPAGSVGLSSPTAIDRAADGGEDQRGRPAEHQRTASGRQRAKDAVARRQHDIAVTQRREGDEREVEGIVVGLERAEQDEEPSPQSDLRQVAKEQRHHGADRDPECPPELGRAPRAATDEADAGEKNGLCHDLQRHRAAYYKKNCGEPAHRRLPNRAFPRRSLFGYRQRTQLTDAPLAAVSSLASLGGRSRRRSGRAAPGLEERERDGDQCRADEQAEEAERDEPAEHAQDRQAHRHRHADTDQKGLDEIVNYGDDEAPEDHEHAPALLVLTKQPIRRATPDHDDQRRADLAERKQQVTKPSRTAPGTPATARPIAIMTAWMAAV